MKNCKSFHPTYILSVISLLIISNAAILKAQNVPLVNIEGRNTTSLDGDWQIIIDPYESGFYNYRHKESDNGFFRNEIQTDKTQLIEYKFTKEHVLKVPGDWNSQDPMLFYYEGTVWYKKDFKIKNILDKRLFIYFGAANYESVVYVNGTKVGTHIGGFTPFCFEITSLIKKGNNFVVVKVDNKRHMSGVPTIMTDWWNYGGITRDVYVVEEPKAFIQDYFIQLKKNSFDQIEGFVKLNGITSKQNVKIEIPGVKIEKTFETNDSGYVNINIPVENLSLWSPGNPKLYKVIVSSGNDKIKDRIGFRTISTKGTDIILNGKSVFLRGISIHEENPLKGRRAYSKEDDEMLLGWAKELGCNFVRLAHYPHNENMIHTAEEMGLMVWEETPVYWTIDWKNKNTLANAENQLSEAIERDKNSASVIIWSMGNETPVSDARNEFLIALSKVARKMDGTRLISAAMEKHTNAGDPLTQIVQDPFADYVDVLAFNEYIGWYDGLPVKCSRVKWEINYEKPVIITEFGADALGGYHADKLTRFSEEYQEDLYKQQIAMLKKIPQLRGMTPWILCDFRSPRRVLPYYEDGWNRKGLISNKGIKKKAFYVLQKFYKELSGKE
ncbi:MAG TPA: glycoside hydrolase family 2 TIM barrel-domain containing protein [Ignavibacteriaceae bacterium]|nr:glycoside hydrolase family 2 TIM barrel-domain containing protein [Ignavibacteriaceae bacterium]